MSWGKFEVLNRSVGKFEELNKTEGLRDETCEKTEPQSKEKAVVCIHNVYFLKISSILNVDNHYIWIGKFIDLLSYSVFHVFKILDQKIYHGIYLSHTRNVMRLRRNLYVDSIDSFD